MDDRILFKALLESGETYYIANHEGGIIWYLRNKQGKITRKSGIIFDTLDEVIDTTRKIFPNGLK